MIEKVFIRTETSISSSWADSLETLNTFYSGDSSQSSNRPDVTKINDYEQVGNTYVRIDNRMRLFKNRNTNSQNLLCIGIPTPIENQSVAYNEINFTKIIESLKSKKYESVQYGFIFNEKETVNESKVVEKSIPFARNIETKRFENLITGEEVSSNNLIQMAIWFTCYRIGDTGINYVVTNPNLLMVHEDIDGVKNDIEFITINSHDGNFKSSVFSPSFSEDIICIGDNTLLTSQNDVEIDVLGNSFLHGFKGQKLDVSEMPEINLAVESSVPFTYSDNKLKLDMQDKKIAYVKYRWITGTPLDYGLVGKESLIYNYVILNLK